MCLDKLFNIPAPIVNNWLLFLNLVLTSVITICIQIAAKNEKKKIFLDNQLFELQRLSFNNPFVDNKKYTQQWNDLKKLYDQNELTGKELDNFLKYDVYTEMLFNYIEMSLNYYKTEKKILEKVNLKSWARLHAQNWQNPLEAHSNHEDYNKSTCNMIDNWLK